MVLERRGETCNGLVNMRPKPDCKLNDELDMQDIKRIVNKTAAGKRFYENLLKSYFTDAGPKKSNNYS